MRLGPNRLTRMNAMPSDPRLAALPALRKRAEEEAKTLADVCADTFALHMGDDMPAMYERGWDGMHEDERDALTAAHLTLLSDLSRPASRWELAVLVCARLGWDPVDVLQAIQNGGLGWIDLCRDANVDAAEIECKADAEALTLIAIAVLGGAT